MMALCVRLKISITRITCGAREAMVARTADERGQNAHYH